MRNGAVHDSALPRLPDGYFWRASITQHEVVVELVKTTPSIAYALGHGPHALFTDREDCDNGGDAVAVIVRVADRMMSRFVAAAAAGRDLGIQVHAR